VDYCYCSLQGPCLEVLPPPATFASDPALCGFPAAFVGESDPELLLLSSSASPLLAWIGIGHRLN